MRKPRKIALAKETLRHLDLRWLKTMAAGNTDVHCAWPNVGQHTCAYSNCASCASP